MGDVSADFNRFSRNELMDKCCITCILKWEFKLSYDQGQGESLFVVRAKKSVGVQCCVFSPSIMPGPVQCPSIKVLDFFLLQHFVDPRGYTLDE
jgi:hypothetical protein